MYFYKCKYSSCTEKRKSRYLCSIRKVSNRYRYGNLWLMTVREEKSVASSTCFISKVYKAALSAHHIRTCIFFLNPNRSMLWFPELSDKVGSRSRKIVRIRNWDRIRPFWHKNLLLFFLQICTVLTRRVADPHHFNADPHPFPAFTLLRIRIQLFTSIRV